MSMELVEFVKSFCDGRLEMPLREAARLAGLNPETIRNDALSPARKDPELPLIKRGGRIYVSSVALHRYFFPEEGEKKEVVPREKVLQMRRGAPTLQERNLAASRGMTVPELRRSVLPGGGKENVGKDIVCN